MSSNNGTTRTEERTTFDVPTRLKLLEHDADSLERLLIQNFDKLDKKFSRILWALWGVFTTTFGGAVAIVISTVVLSHR